MPDSSLVSTGKPKVAGAVFRAPAGTSLPTDATSTLSGAFVDLGYISEDGITNNNSAEVTVIREWGGQQVLSTPGEKSDEWTLTFIESINPNVLEAVYGAGNVTTDLVNGKITVVSNADAIPESVYVIDMALTDGAMRRVVLPCAQVGELGEITYKADEAVGYEVTLRAMPDSSGNTHYEYIKLAGSTSYALSLSPSTVSVAHGSTTQLTATTTPAHQKVVWGSSDTTKATVDQSGLVTGVAAGSATITANLGGITKSCTVTVT